MPGFNQEEYVRLAQETVAACTQGKYRAPSGKTVLFQPQLLASIAGTRSIAPGEHLALGSKGQSHTEISVRNMTTLSAAQDLIGRALNPVILNFASAKSPGGGFLRGANAQEEYLARSTALYSCLAGNPMYDFHQLQKDPLYSDHMIYSPAVPVIRDDEGMLLEDPYFVGIISAPAVNASRLDAGRHREIEPAMTGRIARILRLGLAQGHDAIVLGAWGCGVFRNEPALVARWFGKALRGKFRGSYREVVFAVLDQTSQEKFIGPFRKEFGGQIDV